MGQCEYNTVVLALRLIQMASYKTSLIGRMHFCGPDQRYGFEHRPIGEKIARPVGMPPKGGPLWTKFPAITAGQSRPAVEITEGRTEITPTRKEIQ